MAEFLTTSGVSDAIERIISGAQSRLVLVTPYLKLPQRVFERLQDAERKKVEIVLVYGKGELNDDQYERLSQLVGLRIFFQNDLHAKCYCNESLMVITSMNLHEFSIHNNREVGVLIDKRQDWKLYRDAMFEVESIMRSAQEEGLRGFCIRCGEGIGYHPEAPYCKECYHEWVDEGRNWRHTESHCHGCGRPTESSMDKPDCPVCYKKAVDFGLRSAGNVF